MNKGLTLVELIVAIMIVLVLFTTVLTPLFVRISTTGKGNHTGYITAIEQEGWFFPNYRVYVKTDNSSSQEDVYCLHRDKQKLADVAKQLNKQRKLVNVEFSGVRGIGLGLCWGVEVINISVDKN